MMKNNFLNIHILMCFMLYVLSGILIFSSFFMMNMNSVLILEWKILSWKTVFLSFPLMFDFINLLFCGTVFFISGNVMLFSNLYMKLEVFIYRFLIIVFLFIVSMFFMLFIPHLMSILLGWDGLGIISYCLVIYYQNNKSLGAGMLTVLMNRVGDALLLIVISWLAFGGHWYIFNLWMMVQNDVGCETLLILSFMFVAMTKSAQIPFSSWLPAAMAAPTPVSALVHSSTLVTAGVYLLIRLHIFLSSFSFYLNIVLMISCATLFMAGMSAVSEFDLKKVIALSTLSQLGLMMFSIGLDLPMLSFFHLITHALFKALLFICAGVLISSHLHGQDIRMMGNMVYQSPLILCCLNTCNSALCGLPFLSGFYSKDLIMESIFYSSYSIMLFMGFMGGFFFTVMYSFRLTYIALISFSSGFVLQMVEGNKKDVSLCSISMTVGVISGGCLLNWLMLMPLKDPFLTYDMKFCPLFFIFLSVVFMFMWSKMNFLFGKNLFFLYNFSYYMWFLVPNFSQVLMNLPLKFMNKSLFIDRGWLELLGPNGVYTNKMFYLYKVFPPHSHVNF